jgi:calcineurin-like phosphoesterase family protein
MRDIFVISDTHFSHSNILKFTGLDGQLVRPEFNSVEEMDELMIENWNKTVRDNDIVYHLGDVYFNKGHTNLSRLRGRKRLILGNHDNGKSMYLQNTFQKIMMWRMFPEFNIVMSHVPIHESSLNTEKCAYNVHGHIHEKNSPSDRHINVSVEKINYTPISIDEIRKNML